MKTKKILKLTDRLFNLWVVHYLIYNLWYGFNKEPINGTEDLHDTISTWVLTIVLIVYMSVIFRILRHYVERNMRDR